MCVAAAIAGAGLAGVAGSAISASGARSAADTQSQATQSQIAQQNYEFNTVRDLLKPYVNAGTNALGGYSNAMGAYSGILGQINNLTGANGSSAQQSAITGLQQLPLYTNSMNLGQQAILANASATGGLRGGNTIASLGYLPGQILSNVMQQQLGNLGVSLTGQGNVISQYGNLINLGENAAAGTGQAALSTGNNITSALGQQGAIGAGSILAGTNAITGGINSVAGALGSYLGSGSSGGSYGFSLPGATNSTSAPYYFNAAGLTSPTGIAVGG